MNYSRRLFLNQTFATVAASHFVSQSMGASQALGASNNADRLRLASIGVGGMGSADLQSLSSHQNVDVVALCDVDNDYTNGWTNEQKIDAFFTKEGEGRGF